MTPDKVRMRYRKLMKELFGNSKACSVLGDCIARSFFFDWIRKPKPKAYKEIATMVVSYMVTHSKFADKEECERNKHHSQLYFHLYDQLNRMASCIVKDLFVINGDSCKIHDEFLLGMIQDILGQSANVLFFQEVLGSRLLETVARIFSEHVKWVWSNPCKYGLLEKIDSVSDEEAFSLKFINHIFSKDTAKLILDLLERRCAMELFHQFFRRSRPEKEVQFFLDFFEEHFTKLSIKRGSFLRRLWCFLNKREQEGIYELEKSLQKCFYTDRKKRRTNYRQIDNFRSSSCLKHNAAIESFVKKILPAFSSKETEARMKSLIFRLIATHCFSEPPAPDVEKHCAVVACGYFLEEVVPSLKNSWHARAFMSLNYSIGHLVEKSVEEYLGKNL